MPHEPDNYYEKDWLVLDNMLSVMQQSKIVITNYHAFHRGETIDTNAVGGAILQGRRAKAE